MRRITHTEIPIIREQIKLAQGNKCAICRVSFTDAKLVKGKLIPKYIAVLDHDHKTGAIRGVLCNSCNGSEGKIKNRVVSSRKKLTMLEWLDNLAEYWRKHSGSKTGYLHPTFKTTDEKRLLTNKKARLKRAQIKAAKLLGK